MGLVEQGRGIVVLAWEGPAGESRSPCAAGAPGEANHRNVTNLNPRSGCSESPRDITSSTHHCVNEGNEGPVRYEDRKGRHQKWTA